MKVFFIANRYTSNQDVLESKFGRNYSIAHGLADLGHEVILYCADYKKKQNVKYSENTLTLYSANLNKFNFPLFCLQLFYTIKKNNPDIIIGACIPLWGFIGKIYALLLNKKYAYDVMDNYEADKSSFKSRIMGYIHKLNLVFTNNLIVVSNSLNNKYKNEKYKILVLPNSVDINTFKPINKLGSKKFWKFSKDLYYVGYCGSIEPNRGIEQLQKAFLKSWNKNNKIKLILAGGLKRIDIINHEAIIYLGKLEPSKIPSLLNALDLVVIPNPENEFTKYCFPYKLVEAMACNCELLVSKVGEASFFNLSDDNYITDTNNIESFSENIIAKLNQKNKIDLRKIAENYTEKNLCITLEKYLLHI